LKNIAIFGATGATGHALLAQAVKYGQIHTIAELGRRKCDIADSKITFIDISHAQWQLEFKPTQAIDTVFCCLGTTIKDAGSQEAFSAVDYGLVLKVGQWCKVNGVQHLAVVSSMGANVTSSIFYSKVKGQAEEALTALNLPQLAIYRPALLLAQRAQMRVGEYIAQKMSKALSFLFVGPLRAFKAMPVSTLAKVMLTQAQHQNKALAIVENQAIHELGA
jgi:hypothetical protein